ncbi:class I SAM-dependent methyltransferase [Acidicapsa ligni]|uniref:class I SAM-dependent methyltransferase n=1 Tax=Acidicapsa ligni TaxID=542300 RepID=UPI0021E0C484|nr:class I SAM-dependent methyltransferase [Acidicapsa ligni]
MTQDPKFPTANFNRLAHVYRWMEYLSFGPFLSRCRFRLLPQLNNCRKALVLGDGDGRFTARLLDRHRNIRVHALDASDAMLASLRKAAAQDRDRLDTDCVDVRTWQPLTGQPPAGRNYDLIVTHFFLDCLATEEIADLASRLDPVTSPGTLWVVSEFSIPKGWFGKLVAMPLVAILYRSFHWLTGLAQQTLPDYRSALARAGWKLEGEQTYLGGLLVSQLWRRN